MAEPTFAGLLARVSHSEFSSAPKGMGCRCQGCYADALRKRVEELRDKLDTMSALILDGELMPSAAEPMKLSETIKLISVELTTILGEKEQPK